jgi:hypothetical protein
MGLQIQVLNASTIRDIDTAFATLASDPTPSSSPTTPSSSTGASN